MRQTPVDNYLEEISTELPEELYGNLSDAIYETVCEFDEEVAQLKDENAKLRELLLEIAKLVTNPYGGCLRPGCAHGCPHHLECDEELHTCFYVDRMRELGVEVDG